MSNNHGDIVIEAPAGYKWDEGTLKKITYVAEAGGVKYDSLQKAIDAAKSKAVVTMLADTRENVTISKALTLDLNGFTLNGSTGERKAALKVDNATVTVMDSSANQTGTISARMWKIRMSRAAIPTTSLTFRVEMASSYSKAAMSRTPAVLSA